MSLLGCGTLSRIEYDKEQSVVVENGKFDDLKTEIDLLAIPLIDAKITPGVLVAVLTPDQHKHYFSYGVADKLNGQPINKHTLFAIGSVSKGFLANTVASFVSDGIISWKTTLAEVLPFAASFSDDAKNITIEQLATHMSGLPRQPMTPETLSKFIRYTFTGESFYEHFSDDYIMEYLKNFKKPRLIEPQYSNIGYGILGWVVKQVGGKSIDEAVEERILNPLALIHTGFDPARLDGYEMRARGYSGDQPKFIRRGHPTPDWLFTTFMRGSGGMYSSGEDLLMYAAAHMAKNANPLTTIFDDTLSVRIPRTKEGAALAWIEDQVDGHKIIYQVGLVAGYTTYIGIVRETNIAVVILQNSFNWTNNIGHRLLLRMTKRAQQNISK